MSTGATSERGAGIPGAEEIWVTTVRGFVACEEVLPGFG